MEEQGPEKNVQACVGRHMKLWKLTFWFVASKQNKRKSFGGALFYDNERWFKYLKVLKLMNTKMYVSSKQKKHRFCDFEFLSSTDIYRLHKVEEIRLIII